MRIALVVLVLLAACHRTEDVYPKEMVDNFMQNCTQRGDKRSCRCELDALQRRFTVEQFDRAEDWEAS